MVENDNQKLSDKMHRGLISNTINNASAQAFHELIIRFDNTAAINTESIIQALCVGRENPESELYKIAINK